MRGARRSESARRILELNWIVDGTMEFREEGERERLL